MTFNRPDPTPELREFVEVTAEIVAGTYGTPDIYWSETGVDAVLITDGMVVEVYEDPDEDTGYVADYTERVR